MVNTFLWHFKLLIHIKYQKANKRAHIIKLCKENAFMESGDMDHYMTLFCYPKENMGDPGITCYCP